MTTIGLIDVEEQPTVGMRRRVPVADLPEFFDEVFNAVAAAVTRAGAHLAGAPYARYRGMPTDIVDVEAGFPLTEPYGGADPELVAGSLPAARAIEAVHQGGYETLRATYAQVEAWATEHRLQPLEEVWERYESGPSSDPDPATWRTRIVWPVARPQVEGS